MTYKTLAELYQHFDDLVSKEVSSDELFASSYLRGFISLLSSEYGDDSQLLTYQLAGQVSQKLAESRSELNPADRNLINDYWSKVKQNFIY